ncbi:MAG: hypothetical protein ACFHVJ_01500 [Aestuariibacter sp.]
MGDWVSAFIFGLALLAFVLGLSSVIMGFMTPKQEDALKKQVEYGFFGVAGLVISLLCFYAMS